VRSNNSTGWVDGWLVGVYQHSFKERQAKKLKFIKDVYFRQIAEYKSFMDTD